MKRAVTGIDHVVVMVDGLDAAEQAYRRLGFQMQPRGFHQKLGTANHLMIFERDYFEILGIVEETQFNAERRRWLAQGGGGLANVALATDGADLAHESFTASGLQPDPPLSFDRAVAIDGRLEQARFRTVRIPKTHMPVVGFFVCEHVTPQFVYRREWARHENGARGLLGVTVLCARPVAWIETLERYFGAGSTHREGGDVVVDTGRQPIRYLDRASWVHHYPGLEPAQPEDHPALLSIAVHSLAACAAVLARNGVDALAPGDGQLLVPPGRAANLALEFREG